MTLKEGDIINGRYRLVSERGRGTFGEVWQAWDEILDMEVALKIYIALDDRGVDEFKSEYRTAFKLNHPNLLHATYFDVLEKRPYLVMPYCPVSTDEMVGRINEDEAWKFIKDVSSGLAYLHSKNILHRDIKPDNILVDEQGDFLISDFGISQKMRNTLRRNSVKDLPGSGASGTVGYMGPEMFSSSPEAVKATDIWALGATLFELLEGELPFFGQGGVMLLHGAEIPDLKGSWSDSLKSTLSACLARDTWERPKADELELFSSSRMAGSKVEAPWEKRWRDLKKAEAERERLEAERRRILEEERAEEARRKAEEEERRRKEEEAMKRQEAERLRKEEEQRRKEDMKRQKEEAKRLREEEKERNRLEAAKNAEAEKAASLKQKIQRKERREKKHPIWPWLATLVAAGVVGTLLWSPWDNDSTVIPDQLEVREETPVTDGDNGLIPETVQEPQGDTPETVKQITEEDRLAAEQKRKEAERLAKERKEREELAKKKAAEEANNSAEQVEKTVEEKPSENPLQAALNNNDWQRVKQLADSGDTDACAEYARHNLIESDMGAQRVAHQYAIRAGRDKGLRIITRLRGWGLYDVTDLKDPGWK